MIMPIKTISEANVKEHWGAKSRRAKSQRRIAKLHVHNYIQALPRGYLDMLKRNGMIITLIRINRTAHVLDDDNLARSLKAVRDGVAEAIGLDDGNKAYTWKYEQRKESAYAVEVFINEKGGHERKMK